MRQEKYHYTNRTTTLDLAHPALWLVTWDPSQPTATRPLAINISDDGLYFPTVDITKNICEVFGPAGYIRTAYAYAPFGAVTASGDVTQPFQWSSEYHDSELDLVYYNYRHYSPSLGRFLSRDPIAEQGGLNLYAFAGNNAILEIESLGLARLVLNVTKRLVKNYDSCIYGWTEGVWSTHHIPYLVCEKSKNGKYFLYRDKNERMSVLSLDVWYLQQGSTVIRQGKEYTITNYEEWLIYKHEMLRVNAYRNTVFKALHAGDASYNKILGKGCNCKEAEKDWFRQEKIFLRESNIEIKRAKSRLETALVNVGCHDRPL